MPAWLGWVAVVLLSLYLAVYPALATGLAWRFGRDDRVVLVLSRRRLGDHRMAARDDVHRLPVEPGRGGAVADPADRRHAADRHLWPVGLVVLLGGAIWLEYYKKWLPLVVILGVTALLWLLPSSAVPPDPLTIRNIRIVQPNIGQEDKWRPGFDDEAARRLATAVGPAEPASRGCCSGPRRRSPTRSRTRAPTSTGAFAEFQRTRAASLLGPGDFC